MANLFRFKIWLQTMISPFFENLSTPFPQFRSQILQYQPLIGILLKYFQIPIQICRLNGNGFRNGELIEIQNLVSNNDFTIFRTFFNTISQIPQPNIAMPTSHWYSLKVLSNTFPNMQTKWKWVPKWRTGLGSKSGCKYIFHHFSYIFHHIFTKYAIKYCNANMSLIYPYTTFKGLFR